MSDHPESKRIPLRCSITGIVFGELIVSVSVPGSQPYISAFRESITYHPIFSLSLSKNLAVFRNTLERQLSGESQDDSLEVSFVSLLYKIGSLEIRNPHKPIIPTRNCALSNGHRLIHIVQRFIQKSFKPPVLVISSFHENENMKGIKDYLELLVDFLAAQDKKRDSFDEEERAIIQSSAIASIRRPERIAKKSLWRWCENFIIHSSYKPDVERLHYLFFAGKKEILSLKRDELSFLLTTLESILPLGTPLLTEVRKHCEAQLTTWENHFKDFWIVDTVAEMWAKTPLPEVKWTEDAARITVQPGEPKPVETDFPKRSAYIVALARWNLANSANRQD